jgi:hypothetical protein
MTDRQSHEERSAARQDVTQGTADAAVPPSATIVAAQQLADEAHQRRRTAGTTSPITATRRFPQAKTCGGSLKSVKKEK